MAHLILVGACYLDTILTVPHYPQEDSKLRATAVQVRRGGNCANSLEVLAQLVPARLHNVGPDLHLVSCLPEAGAPATAKILASFGDESDKAIDFSHSLYRDDHQEPASSYIIRSEATGSRTIVNSNHLPEMTATEFEMIADSFVEHAGSCWWHFEGRIPETTLRCIRHLRRVMPGCTISVEVEKPNRDGLAELAAEADVIFYSRSWAQHRGYANPEACLRAEAASSMASLMCCTWGEEGAGALATKSGEYVHCAAPQAADGISVVDTIGAGDTFIAGMLYALHADAWPLEVKLEFAVGLATKKVQREGFAGLLP